MCIQLRESGRTAKEQDHGSCSFTIRALLSPLVKKKTYLLPTQDWENFCAQQKFTNLSTFTLCARSFDERRDWSDAIRHASSEPDTRSLNIEGLNLECGQLSKEARRPLFDKKDDALFRRRKALYELRKETAELQDACRKHLTFHDWNQKLATIDNKYDRAFVSTQQEALRKATLLRQRKISTQLKIDMLKKQLPSNQRTKSHRPQLPECVEENRQEVETQLEELTSKLHQIEDVLGETERKAMVALQKLDIRRKEEVQILRETADSPVAGSSAREEGATGISPRNVESPVDSEFLPRICLSMSADDCSVTGSHRAKPTLPSSKRRYFTDVLKSTSSVPSLIFTSTKGGKHQMHQQEQSAHLDDGLSSTQDSAAGSAVSLRQKKTRRSPLRAFGNFVDSRLLRRWRVEKRTRSADLTPPSEHHESSSHDDPFHHHSMPESSDGDMRPRASTFTTPHANRLPTSSVSSNSDPFLQCAGDSAPNQSGSMSLESHSSGDEAPEKSATHSVDEEDSSIERTDETAGSKKPTPSSSIDNPSAGELRTEINPETLAEIEAFELMAQDYLRHHRQEQLTT